jgi:Xaa-Pro dipeptidase
LQERDTVLLHANTYVDGYWTDITRTFSVGEPSAESKQMFSAIADARRAALEQIRPGVLARDVDRAARDVLAKHGFAELFTHGLGHEVGFGAINAADIPRLHPRSPDRLRSGMTFNIEPAIYKDGVRGIRHCDVVMVTESEVEVLTPWLPIGA